MIISITGLFTYYVEICKILVENITELSDKVFSLTLKITYYVKENIEVKNFLKRICANKSFCFNFAVKWKVYYLRYGE